MWEVGKNHDRIRSNMEYPQSYMGYMDMTLVHMQLHNVCVCACVSYVSVCVCAAGCRPLTNWDAGPSERPGPRAGLNLTNS